MEERKTISYKEMAPDLKERLQHIHWTIYIANQALTELYTVTYEDYSKTELKIVNSSTFNFYKVTLQYCFIMEYNKLMEGKSRNDQNICSLQQLNEKMLISYKDLYAESYERNVKLINNLRESDYRNYIKGLRDKKFAHADLNKINQPYEIR